MEVWTICHRMIIMKKLDKHKDEKPSQNPSHGLCLENMMSDMMPRTHGRPSPGQGCAFGMSVLYAQQSFLCTVIVPHKRSVLWLVSTEGGVGTKRRCSKPSLTELDS